MEFNSSYDKKNFMGCYPPSPISNDGWEYHQQITDPEHSNSWRFASETQDEQENHMGYFPPPQNNSSHYSNGGWEYHQGMKEHPSSRPSFSFKSSSSLDYASTRSFLQNPYKSSHQSHNSFHTPQHNFTTTHSRHKNYSQPSSLELAVEDYLQWSKEPLESQCQAIEIHRKLVERYTQPQSWKETILKKMNGPLEQTKRNLEPSNSKDEDQFVSEEVEKQDEEAFVSSKISIEKEVVEAFEHVASYSQKLIEVIEEPETSLPKELVENHEEEMEKDTQEKSHSTEAEKCKEEKPMEPPMQEALNEEITPTTTQPPKLRLKEVKAINKSTEKRIVTKLQRTTFKRRSTANNPSPELASKLNQAMYKRRLAEKRLRKGTTAETFPPLRSFLLTNWKKRKKVKNNMSS
ncbi:uncharacterized protein DS421_12g367430 [Arachis hypogaea]|nr:uncharacterized protein DS421_12g367430 [Arachis hypogaea]